MNCDEFLERFSEFRDREVADEESTAFEGHVAECDSCRRYREVVDRGVEVARSLEGLRPRSDFQERLRHRIYHADLTEAKKGRSGSSPFVTLALAGAAVLAGIGAWGPMATTVFQPPAVELPPISASAPASEAHLVPIQTGDRTVPATRSPAFLSQSDLWAQSGQLLYEHSTLYHRSRAGTLIQATGLH